MIFKKVAFSLLLLLISSFTLADSVNVERKFNIYAKIPLMPKIKIMEINTLLLLFNNEYKYEFDIRSKNIVNFINQIDGNGTVHGKMINSYKPNLYEYEYTRKNKKKYVQIKYQNEKIIKIVTKPNYDKSKLTPITDEMLVNTIDPSTFFLSVLNFENMNKCKRIFRVFDGKRRYDVKFEKMITSNENSIVKCDASQIKLGGYKDSETDVFAASDFIQVIYSMEKKEFLGYEARNGNIKILIDETRK